jgi:hypothetical protein
VNGFAFLILLRVAFDKREGLVKQHFLEVLPRSTTMSPEWVRTNSGTLAVNHFSADGTALSGLAGIVAARHLPILQQSHAPLEELTNPFIFIRLRTLSDHDSLLSPFFSIDCVLFSSADRSFCSPLAAFACLPRTITATSSIAILAATLAPAPYFPYACSR